MLKIRSVKELAMDKSLTKPPMILDPWLPAQGLAMIAGRTGIGKTMVSLGVALTIASGSCMFNWSAPQPRRILYIDGEMALIDMQERLRALIKGHPEWKKGLDNMILISHEDQEKGIPNMVQNKKVRTEIEGIMADNGVEVLILDNLSALCNSDVENDVESWTVMQDWLLELRRRGFTVIFLHHTGKPVADNFGTMHTNQRGTSKREDVLNTSILLEGWESKYFHVVWKKHRGFEDYPLYGSLDFSDDCCKIEMREKKQSSSGRTRRDNIVKVNEKVLRG